MSASKYPCVEPKENHLNLAASGASFGGRVEVDAPSRRVVATAILLSLAAISAVQAQTKLDEEVVHNLPQVFSAAFDKHDGHQLPLDPDRAVALYQKAWQDGVPIAAYFLGHFYEAGVTGSQPDLAMAWEWYQKGTVAGEPHALARFAERSEQQALAESNPETTAGLLLHAFSDYAAAAERAHDEDWPDEAWRYWRYRRATLARLLARQRMMQQVADAYTQVLARTRR